MFICFLIPTAKFCKTIYYLSSFLLLDFKIFTPYHEIGPRDRFLALAGKYNTILWSPTVKNTVISSCESQVKYPVSLQSEANRIFVISFTPPN